MEYAIEVGPSIVDVLMAHEEAEKAADAEVKEWQRNVKIGDCFRQRVSDCLDIYGEVIGNGLGVNWRSCRCYSFACPNGEAGSVHVSQMDEIISKKAFEEMKIILSALDRTARINGLL